MEQTIEFLTHYGYLVLFGLVFAEQIGLPLPAVPILLASGAMAGEGFMSFPVALVVGVTGALLADAIWFKIGDSRGLPVLVYLCRMALEPASCVSRTEGLYFKYGARSLLVAKFVPGLNTVAPPLAGVFGMKWTRFLAYDAGGALLWVGAFSGTGYLFSSQIGRMADSASQLGLSLGVTLLCAVGGYGLWKYLERLWVTRQMRVGRIDPEALMGKLEAGEELVVVDLRKANDFASEPYLIAGAIRMDASQLYLKHKEIPRDRDMILYCT